MLQLTKQAFGVQVVCTLLTGKRHLEDSQLTRHLSVNSVKLSSKQPVSDRSPPLKFQTTTTLEQPHDVTQMFT